MTTWKAAREVAGRLRTIAGNSTDYYLADILKELATKLDGGAMTRSDDINALAKALCDSILRADPDDGKPWDDLHEIGRQYYRQRVKDLLLNDEALMRLLTERARDDGTEVAFGGEPGASVGDSE